MLLLFNPIYFIFFSLKEKLHPKNNKKIMNSTRKLLKFFVCHNNHVKCSHTNKFIQKSFNLSKIASNQIVQQAFFNFVTWIYRKELDALNLFVLIIPF